MKTSTFPARKIWSAGATPSPKCGVVRRSQLAVAFLAASVWLCGGGGMSLEAQTVDTVITNRLAEPYGVATDANVYYLTDSANDRIVKFVPDTGVFTTLAGFSGRPGNVDGKGVYARFFSPRGILSVPQRGGLVVSDYANHTLRLVKLDGTVTTLAGTAGVPGFDGTHFNFPSALAVDASGAIYIADTKNNAVRKFDLANVLSTVVAGLNEPNGVAVGDNGELWIANSRDHTIRHLLSSGTLELAAGIPGQSGALDSIFASETLFNNPTELLWLGGNSGLLVSDTGNHALRQVVFDPEIGTYSVETFAGVLAQPGFVDGPVLQARFKLPSGLVKDPVGGFLIAELGNNSLRRIQTSPPRPPVQDPVIGYVTYSKDQFGELLSSLAQVSEAVFNNDVTIAVRTEAGTETYFTFGPTPASALEDDIPSPSRLTGNSPPPYHDGSHPSEVGPSMISPAPDVTIKAIGTQDGRRPSAVVQARFQFKTANPSIVGDNPAFFSVTNITTDAQMWYTTDGSEPVANAPGTFAILSGITSLPKSKSPIQFRIRAFRTNFKPSEIVSKTFLPENFEANRMSFGFENGEASSDFVASPGQKFIAPVTLTLLPQQAMYSLQFAVTVNSLNGSPAVAKGAVGFDSALKEKLEGNLYRTIPPALFTNLQSVPDQIAVFPYYSDLQITNTAINLLAVGWLERAGATNLYDTTKQDLITYSIAHDTVHLSKEQKVIVGGYAFTVPTAAAPGQQYEIAILRPSATSDGVGQDNFIEPAADGSFAAGAINAVKHVTVGQTNYIVGDAAPFRWFNAGDFGEGLLLNNDVMQVFQSSVYYLNQPPSGSDFFDAMDSSDGTQSGIFFGDDSSINNISLGDGQLNVDDVYVTFRRSLDPTLNWYRRYWQGGKRLADIVPNVQRGAADLPGERWSMRASDLPANAFIAGTPAVTFSFADLNVTPGQTVQLPVRAKVIGSYPLRVLMLNLTVESLDGAPALTQPVQFTPASALGDPTATMSQGPENYAAVWLNSKVTGLAGDAVVGVLKIVVPEGADPSSAYRVHFGHASASPNGLGIFPKQIQDGLLTFKDRNPSTLGDGIPDSWRLRYFGTISNVLAQAAADADGDGASNWAEFMAGTNPTEPNSHLRLAANELKSPNGQPLTLRWPSVANKTYILEAAPSVTSTNWSVLASGISGTGQEIQVAPGTLGGAVQFFRVRVAE